MTSGIVFICSTPALKKWVLGDKSWSSVMSVLRHRLTLYSITAPVCHWSCWQGEQIRGQSRGRKLWLPACRERRSPRQADTQKALTPDLGKRPWPLGCSWVTSLRVFPDWLGLQPNLGHEGGDEIQGLRAQPAEGFSAAFSTGGKAMKWIL